jgi:hypothetical protein
MHIPIYIQQDAVLHSLFMSGNCCTCFGWYLHPSSGAHTTVSTASGTCQTVIVPAAVGAGSNVEQFSDINKLCNTASCWICIGIYLRCTDPSALNKMQFFESSWLEVPVCGCKCCEVLFLFSS